MLTVGDLKELIKNNKVNDDCIIKIVTNGTLTDIELALPYNTKAKNGNDKPFDVLTIQ